jgi:O-antigen/teichoic acid export membrane protein
VLCSVWQFAATRRFLEEAFGGPLGGRLADMRGQWRAHVRTLVILGITDTLKTISTDADNLIIGAFHSPATVGPFRAAQTIVAGLHQLATPLYMVYYPEMSKAVARGEPEAARRLAGQIGLLGLLGGGAAAAMLTIAAPWLVPALYGPGFDAAVPAMQLMAWSLLVIAVGWANPLFVSTGRPALTLIMIAAGVVVKLALLLALVPGLPNLGAAIAFVGSYAAVGVASIVLARVVLGFRAGGA